jgi:hypothetical protein
MAVVAHINVGLVLGSVHQTIHTPIDQTGVRVAGDYIDVLEICVSILRMVQKKWESGQIYFGPFEDNFLTWSGIDKLGLHPFSREFGYPTAALSYVTVESVGVLLPC